MLSVLGAIRAYTAADDPLVGAGNSVALVLAANQPLYPLYLVGLFGSAALPSLVQIAVTPAFAVVPLLCRRWPLGGRVFFLLVCNLNTIIYIKLIGRASGLELFLFPCAMLAAFLFRKAERRVMLLLAALPAVLYFALGPYYEPSLIRFDADAYATMRTMNTISIATLIAFFGIVFSGVLATIEERCQ